MSFEQALAFTLKEEGGFVDNPADPGGATCRGVTQLTYNAYRSSRGEPYLAVAQISDAETQDIYRTRYWEPGHCADLSPKLGICHFDWSVNHGLTGALLTLQQAAGVKADGKFGAETLAAVQRGGDGLYKNYDDLRRAWYLARVKARPDQRVFLKGWLGRVDRLDAYVEQLQ